MIRTIEPNTALALAYPGHRFFVERPNGGVLTFSTVESAKAWVDHNCPDKEPAKPKTRKCANCGAELTN